ncbi:MAG: DUF4271 domain-containing protein [Flavobacteriales bacterium]|nr:DUF4271 domain-containing protein [Flavobacteriales bacterium]
MESILRVNTSIEFYSYAFLVLLFVLAILKAIFYRSFRLIATNDIENQVSGNTSAVGVLLSIVLVMVFPLVVIPYSLLEKKFLFLDVEKHYGLLMLLFLLFMLGKHLLSRFYFYIFQRYDSIGILVKYKYFFIFLRLILFLGLVCFNFFFPFQFSDFTKFTILVSFFLFSYIIEWIFLFVNKIGAKFHWFHNILYLCTLEILPLIILVKVLFGEEIVHIVKQMQF